MPDRSIPFYNLILKCTGFYADRELWLPPGFSVVGFAPGYEKAWAEMEFEEGDFSSADEAESYFREKYVSRPERMKTRAVFVLDPQKRVVGSCIAWDDEKNGVPVDSLHWLIVDKNYRGLGLGRALCRSVMNIFAETGSRQVYIHTQPWSWKAILLYVSEGFKLQKTDSFSEYTNQYAPAMEALKNVVTEEQYRCLCVCSE